MHRRVVRENSAIQRTYDELFPKGADGKRAASRENSPHLFSIFLDPTKSQADRHRSVAFAFDVAILVPDYEIDGVLWLKRHFEGGYLVRKLIVVEATRDDGAPAGWRIEYGFQSETPNAANTVANTRARGRSAQVRDSSGVADQCEAGRPRPAPLRNASVGVASTYRGCNRGE